ncbi:hypothetical protein B0H14DRAFT_799669 [Mycena olivaceomarginata]|nr:hypothetical protein B0H14DRAFT_799669 [Mycena olivaceomarginata]
MFYKHYAQMTNRALNYMSTASRFGLMYTGHYVVLCETLNPPKPVPKPGSRRFKVGEHARKPPHPDDLPCLRTTGLMGVVPSAINAGAPKISFLALFLATLSPPGKLDISKPAKTTKGVYLNVLMQHQKHRAEKAATAAAKKYREEGSAKAALRRPRHVVLGADSGTDPVPKGRASGQIHRRQDSQTPLA